MADLFKNKYRTGSLRLDADNYADGWYFVTICTENRKIFFGEIQDSQMVLNGAGKIADIYLHSISDHFPNAHTDKYVIMPNHVHAIIVINESKAVNGRDTPRRVSTKAPNVKFGHMVPGSLSAIVNHFKGAVKKWCNKNGYEYFHWQSGYYDHIIRDEKDYKNIWDYIDYNPDKWQWDMENPENFKKK